MKKILNRLFGLVLVFWVLNVSGAEETPPKITPLQLSIWNPVQLAPDDWDVWGLRLNMLYGMNRDLYGLDVGVFNLVRRDFAGIQAGIANLTGTESGRAFTGIQVGVANLSTLSGAGSSGARGLQLAPICNIVGKMSGLQVGFLNFADELGGLQIGTLNLAESLAGIQIGFVMNSSSSMRGVQLGFSNRAADMHGLQFALVNIADNMTGVQIGLVNVIKESPVAFFPIINAHF